MFSAMRFGGEVKSSTTGDTEVHGGNPGVKKIHLFDALRMAAEHLLDAGVHFGFLNELAAIGLGNAFADSGSKACVFLE